MTDLVIVEGGSGTIEVVETSATPLIIEVITEGPQGPPSEGGDVVTSVNGVEPIEGAVTLTKTNLGLGSVENKSSATIRGEMTLQNVTDALGFTPLANSYAPTWAAITGKPTFSSVALTGAYADLSGKPTLSTVASSGSYSDLTGLPSFATVAFSGNYSDLTGLPSPYSLPTGSTTILGGFKVDGTTIVAIGGVLSAVGGGGGGGNIEVKGQGTTLTAAATSIDFTGAGVTTSTVGSAVTVTIPATTLTTLGIPNVENKSSATIRGEITSGNVTTALGFTPLSNSYVPTWASVTGKPSFSTVATSGDYNDLSNKPSIPAAYTLPTATNSVLGGVKVDGTTITIASGVISTSKTAIGLGSAEDKSSATIRSEITSNNVTSALGFTPANKVAPYIDNSITLVGTAPIFDFSESDQTGANGLLRWVLEGNVFYLQKNTATARDYSTATNVITVDATGQLVIPTAATATTGAVAASCAYVIARIAQDAVPKNSTTVPIAASDIDLSLGTYFTKTLTGATTFTVSNKPPAGKTCQFFLELTNGGGKTIVLPTGSKRSKGTALTLTTTGVDLLMFVSKDGGTTWTYSILEDVK